VVVVREQTIAGRYELKYVLGTGGMSSVYCAFDTLLERNVALKVLHDQYGDDEEYVERFRREARSVAQLRTRTSSRSSTAAMRTGSSSSSSR
jgi:serine/threonine protein kinase